MVFRFYRRERICYSIAVNYSLDRPFMPTGQPQRQLREIESHNSMAVNLISSDRHQIKLKLVFLVHFDLSLSYSFNVQDARFRVSNYQLATARVGNFPLELLPCHPLTLSNRCEVANDVSGPNTDSLRDMHPPKTVFTLIHSI